MPRYTLRVPGQGDVLYGDDGEAVVADSIDLAREVFRDELGEDDWIYVHSDVGRCRLVYARDVENGDCHEDAEPGDTTVDYIRDTGRELASNEIRIWQLGPPRWSWRQEPLPPEPIPWNEIPVGMHALHKVLGWGELYAPPRLWRASGKPVFPIRFENGRHADLFLSQISLHYPATYGAALRPPPTRYRLTVEGEVVTEGVTERTARDLLDLRLARLDAEWKARTFAEFEAREMVA